MTFLDRWVMCRCGVSVRHCVLLCVIVLIAGCSGGDPVASVTGKVTVDGEPVTEGMVLFLSEKGAGGSGELQADGTYTLQCPPGQYKVAVAPPESTDPTPAPAKPPEEGDIPYQYQDVGSSGLTAELAEGENTFDIPLESK